MGHKISPLAIREQNKITDWYYNTEKTSHFFLLKNYLFNFFYSKGILINNFLIKKNDNNLFVNIDFFISRSSSLYTKKFRKNLIKKKYKKKIYISIYNFLILISRL